MTNDDLLYKHRVQLFALAQQIGVSRACQQLGFHRSTYYRWKPRLERHGLEILRPRERRPPRMPNQVPPWLEERVVAFALGHPGLGPRRVAAQLALPMWGGQPFPPPGCSTCCAGTVCRPAGCDWRWWPATRHHPNPKLGLRPRRCISRPNNQAI